MNITAGAGANGTTSGAAGAVTITAGAIGTGGNVAGGSINLVPTVGVGTGVNGSVHIAPAVSVPANGVSSGTIATQVALIFGSSGPGIYVGSSTPSLTAAQGSLYIRTDGSATQTRLYVNTNGSTTWTAFQSVT